MMIPSLIPEYSQNTDTLGSVLVSVVIPARDEEESIGMVLDDLSTTLSHIKGGSEVIVVDDYSSDQTAAVARSRGITVISNYGRGGKGSALRKGFAHANGAYIFMMDSDYSHRPEDLPKLLSQLDDGAGLVIASRVFGGSDEYTHVRALGNILLSGLISLLIGIDLRDALNGFKGFRRELLGGYNINSRQFEIEIELIGLAVRKGYRVEELASHERARYGGSEKSFVVRHGLRFLWRILLEAFRFHVVRLWRWFSISRRSV